jgi:hypothetical protein
MKRILKRNVTRLDKILILFFEYAIEDIHAIDRLISEHNNAKFITLSPQQIFELSLLYYACNQYEIDFCNVSMHGYFSKHDCNVDMYKYKFSDKQEKQHFKNLKKVARHVDKNKKMFYLHLPLYRKIWKNKELYVDLLDAPTPFLF